MNIFVDNGKEEITFVVADDVVQDNEATYVQRPIGLKGYMTVSKNRVKRFNSDDSVSGFKPLRKVSAEYVCDVLFNNFPDTY